MPSVKKILILLLCFFLPRICHASPAKLVQAARNQIGKTVFYDGSYERLSYPMGDVPINKGVCTDVVIRALRETGIDLQELIHTDMTENFSQYPNNWGLKRPDPNIDHRRVPNIIKYYERQGKTQPLPVRLTNIKPGDFFAWLLPNGRPHIAVISKIKGKKVYMIHNIGAGAEEEQIVYNWQIIAHIRPFPQRAEEENE